jgi:plastocyanin
LRRGCAGGDCFGSDACGVAAAPVSAPAAARIDGHIRFAGPPARRPVATALYAPHQITTPAAPRPAILNVLVYLENPPKGPVEPLRAEMRQEDETFAPAVLPITVGSTVDFPNEDEYFHNVFSLSHAASFDLGRYPRGQSRSRVFSTPGIVKVFCHLHSHMHGVIVVFDHPYFTTPSERGAFSLDDLPPGTYTVAAWHERVGETREPVTLRAGETAHVEIALPVVVTE